MNTENQQGATNMSSTRSRDLFDQDAYMYSGIGAQYSDVVQLLRQQGYDAFITDTGGGCLAIIAPLDSGRDFLITSNEGPLDERYTLRGWGVGIMSKDGDLDDAQYREINDRAPTALLKALKEFE